MHNSTIFFEKINGKRIFQIFSENSKNTKKIVIMSHGFRGSSIGPARAFVDFEKILLENGYSVLRFDQPNSGNSEGDYLDSSFNQWVETIAYFAKKYLDLGYKVSLLGQSMGATATMIATSDIDLKDKIPCIILWVPDPKTTFSNDPNQIYEEAGQKYRGSFWQEAKDGNFWNALGNYKGKIHLVYGEKDRYISKDLRNSLISKIKEKGQQYMVLDGQNHSPWEFNIAQKVYRKELEFLDNYLS